MKNVLIIGTGGTISMRKDTGGALVPSDSLDELLSVYPELKKLAHLDFYKLMNIDSSNMQPKNWISIAEHIFENYNAYDGFIVTHGTDTMAYTASALSFSLRRLGKPVVITGSMKPPQEVGSDAKRNIINSIKVASFHIPEVCVCFDNKIYRGNRIKKVKNEASKITNEKLSAYSSINYPLLGVIKGEEVILNETYKEANTGPVLYKRINISVASLKLFPGFNSELLESMSKCMKGLVIEVFGAGGAPFIESKLLSELEKLIKNNIAVVVATQCPFGEVDMSMYEVGKKLEEVGVISAKDITSECVIVKLMFALGECKNMDDVRKFMQTNIAGELRQ